MGKYKKCRSKKIKYIISWWNEEFELPDGWYFIYCQKRLFWVYCQNIWDLYWYSFNKTYVNETENRITFKIKIRYYLQLLKFETIKLLESTKSKINKDKNDENELSLEITEVVLVHCDILNNHCKQDSRVLNIYVPNKSFGQLLYISPKLLCF